MFSALTIKFVFRLTEMDVNITLCVFITFKSGQAFNKAAK